MLSRAKRGKSRIMASQSATADEGKIPFFGSTNVTSISGLVVSGERSNTALPLCRTSWLSATRKRLIRTPRSIGELSDRILVPVYAVSGPVRNVNDAILDLEGLGNDWIAPISPLEPVGTLRGTQQVSGDFRV
jgi:hypothetical protein